MFKRILLSIFIVPLVAASAFAHDYRSGEIAIAHPWVRATPPVAKTAAAYMSIVNTGATPDRLLGATSPVAGHVELHKTVIDGGIAKMEAMPQGLEVSPGQPLKVEPGAYHVMLVNLKAPISAGARIPLVLTFERAGDLQVELAVEAGRGPDAHEDHGSPAN